MASVFNRVLTLPLLLFFINCAISAKILGIFHTASYSHFVVPEVLFKELASRGHEVTVVSPYPQKVPVKNYRDLNLYQMKQFMEEHHQEPNHFLSFNKIPTLLKLEMLAYFGYQMVEKSFENEALGELIKSDEKFDLIVIESFLNDAYLGFAHKFKAPAIIYFSSGACSFSNRYAGNPSPPSYIPSFLLPYNTEMNFVERARNLVTVLLDELHYHLRMVPKQNSLMHEHFPDAPHLYDLISNVSFVFLNSFPGFTSPVPLMPNVKEIGGLHLTVDKKLPADVKKFLDENDGVVLFSLGSNFKSKDLPADKFEAILRAFKRWNGPILWKFENESLPEDLPMVKISKWLPQTSVLAHPNLKAFITHGGRLSTLESIYYGVPIIGIPIFAEQPYNIAQAVYAGYGILLEFGNLTDENLHGALHEITSNPIYTERAKLISETMNATKRLDEAVFWVEYVLKFNGADHLKNYGVNLPWYQYLMVDVILFLIVIVLIFAIASCLCCLSVIKICKRSDVRLKVKTS